MAEGIPTVPGKDWVVFAFKVFLATLIINAAFDLLGSYSKSAIKPRRWFQAPFSTWKNRGTPAAANGPTGTMAGQ
jgi:hypothetical protein